MGHADIGPAAHHAAAGDGILQVRKPLNEDDMPRPRPPAEMPELKPGMPFEVYQTLIELYLRASCSRKSGAIPIISSPRSRPKPYWKPLKTERMRVWKKKKTGSGKNGRENTRDRRTGFRAGPSTACILQTTIQFYPGGVQVKAVAHVETKVSTGPANIFA